MSGRWGWIGVVRRGESSEMIFAGGWSVDAILEIVYSVLWFSFRGAMFSN